MPTTRRTMLHAGPLLAATLCRQALAASTPSPKDAYLYFIWPQDGERIHGSF